MNLTYQVTPGGCLHGTVRVPGDKSISHRAIMLGALAEGTSQISGFLEGADNLCTLQAFRDLGVPITRPGPGAVQITGVGLRGLRAATHPLDMGNSGTAMRLMTGLLAGQTFTSTLMGDASLSRRPMQRVTRPLAQMGAQITPTAAGTAPLQIQGTALHGIDYILPVASAQVKSALLLAGLYATGTTHVTEPAPTRDHTERMLQSFGVTVQRSGSRMSLTGGQTLRAVDLTVPADLSSAAFFLVGASLCPGADLLLEHVGINPTRTGVLDILRLMGADIMCLNPRQVGQEPVADLRVRYAPLHGVAIPPELVPLAIDEFPALFIAAACAQGTTTLSGAAELRVKESDRIQVMADGLQALGVQATPTPDGMVITGGVLQSGTVASQGDHRIAMAFAMAGLVAQGALTILDCANVETSFPTFVSLAQAAGLQLTAQVA